jgi:hypothetical protein
MQMGGGRTPSAALSVLMSTQRGKRPPRPLNRHLVVSSLPLCLYRRISEMETAMHFEFIFGRID